MAKDEKAVDMKQVICGCGKIIKVPKRSISCVCPECRSKSNTAARAARTKKAAAAAKPAAGKPKAVGKK